jgi:hypothetical protein
MKITARGRVLGSVTWKFLGGASVALAGSVGLTLGLIGSAEQHSLFRIMLFSSFGLAGLEVVLIGLILVLYR